MEKRIENRSVVISTDMNPDYAYPIPIVAWAWHKIGWLPKIMVIGGFREPYIKLMIESVWNSSIDYAAQEIHPIGGYRNATVAQISRLYAAHNDQNWYYMTSDADMLPLSDYWRYDTSKKTVWGHDLTGYGHYPCCYVGMSGKDWHEVMRLTGDSGADIKRDLDNLPQAKSDDFNRFWFTDQDLITERLKPYNPVHVTRGQYSNGYAIGRVDRGNWTLSHRTFIDAHLFQQVYHKGREQYFTKTMKLLCAIWPEEDFGWFIEYTEKFRKLTGHS